MTGKKREPHFDDEARDTVVADSFTVDFCEHGYGRLAFWHDGERHPFAVAYFEPNATIQFAAMLADNIRTEGRA